MESKFFDTKFKVLLPTLIRDRDIVNRKEPVNDLMYLVGGKTGSGKTTLAYILAEILSSNKKNKIWHTTNFKQILNVVILQSNENDTIIMDEIHNVIDANLAPTKKSKDCIQLFKTCRYKRLKMILVSPQILRLNAYVLSERARLHIEVIKNRKFIVFPEKRLRKNHRNGYISNNYEDIGWFKKLGSSDLNDMKKIDKKNKDETLKQLYDKYFKTS